MFEITIIENSDKELAIMHIPCDDEETMNIYINQIYDDESACVAAGFLTCFTIIATADENVDPVTYAPAKLLEIPK